MKLSNRGKYALRALRHLSMHHGEKPLSASQLASREKLPLKYLEQVLSTLSKSGILISEQGKEGGYSLRKNPKNITLGDIIRAVEGPLAPIPCASRTAPYESPNCPYPFETCWLRQLMLRVRDNISAILDQETLEQMTLDAEKAGRDS
jgi:Rrf2 family cysteine metabolism transcriptional repressor